MLDVEYLAERLSAMGHPVRLKILRALTRGDMYLSEIAGVVGVSRALAKVHLKRLLKAGLVDTRVVLLEEEARARRFYRLQPFEVHLSPALLAVEDDNFGL